MEYIRAKSRDGKLEAVFNDNGAKIFNEDKEYPERELFEEEWEILEKSSIICSECKIPIFGKLVIDGITKEPMHLLCKHERRKRYW